MNYRHLFHAGNFADVFKHSLLLLCLAHYLKKESGFCYIDTHAGPNHYDLMSDAAQRTKEYQNGIAKLYSHSAIPSSLQSYLAVVKKFNARHQHSALQLYPGSTQLVAEFIRPQDRIIANEKHPADFQLLKHQFRHQTQIACHARDAYEFLTAVIPPSPRRGLVLIDPPFEATNEFQNLKSTLISAHAKWPQACYLAWFPIKDLSYKRWYQDLKKNFDNILLAEFGLATPQPTLVNERNPLCANGLIIINPPWPIEDEIKPLLQDLLLLLDVNNTGYHYLDVKRT